MNTHNFIKNHILKQYTQKNLSSSKESFQKSVQVCILGGHTFLGKMTSLVMKQNPIISCLRIQGDRIVSNIAADLNHIDTKCTVQSFEGTSELPKAIRSADIVLLLGVGNVKEDTCLPDRVMAEGRRVYDLAKECSITAPRSIIVVAVPPVSVTTPLVASVFKKTHWYHPGRILGSAAIAQIKANTLVGRYQDLNPFICKVPIIGGPDIDLAVPLFSRAKPVELTDKAAHILMAKFRGVEIDEFPKKTGRHNFVENCPHVEAYALNNMITAIALGICGDKEAFYNALIRTNSVETCQHLVTTLQFSRGGVVHNHGVPQLTKLELRVFEKALLEMKEREQIAAEMLDYIEGKCDVPPFKIKDLNIKKTLQQTVIRC
ncbi:malate dehydrogenase, mitochondrial [Leptinotarsa decemlineata]|uniref:malate dehydrogenase, mitochondrial n=1 Tax=Leptinotarsa decemlineata TaxID=7539 RepID=UPI000C25314C|nr:malate dehydrogenase, mitochondrial-like [Leptinotarsa decemlineata]